MIYDIFEAVGIRQYADQKKHNYLHGNSNIGSGNKLDNRMELTYNVQDIPDSSS